MLDCSVCCFVCECLQKAAATLSLEQCPSVSSLAIYRWANQALETPHFHPLLPLMWQRFMLLYLGRNTTRPGLVQQSDSRLRHLINSVSVISIQQWSAHLLYDLAGAKVYTTVFVPSANTCMLADTASLCIQVCYIM